MHHYAFGGQKKYLIHDSHDYENLDMPNVWGCIKILFWPYIYTHPNCTHCYNNDRDTWPHLLSTSTNAFFKGLELLDTTLIL